MWRLKQMRWAWICLNWLKEFRVCVRILWICVALEIAVEAVVPDIVDCRLRLDVFRHF